MSDECLPRSPVISALLAAYQNEPTAGTPEILWDCSQDESVDPTLLSTCPPQRDRYEATRQLFNRRFQLFPVAIVLCTSAEQVSVAVRFASTEGLPLRVRSGGHDHEGESSATDGLLLDLSGLRQVRIEPGGEPGARHARIGPGIPFRDLTTLLAKADVMVPHGTCDSVCIGGFSMGGGWGPWTRRQGMCCEHILEATMVLGDGSITTARMDGNPAERELLWAIKGGGGFSYGIVTELVIQTFELPWEMYRFSITWNPDNRYSPDPTQADRANAATDATADAANGTPTLHILRAWEQAICSTDGEGGRQLAGTNLKIYAKPLESDASFDPETIRHGCVMYGYWEGDKSSLERFIKAMASATGTPEGSYTSRIGEPAGRKHQQQEGHQYGAMLMNDWHQTSRHELAALGLRKPAPSEARNDDIPVVQGTPYKPDLETPEAHKITSRLVNACGLGSAGHARLLASLTSPLLDDENLDCGLYTYVTLGAITGPYYQDVISDEQKEQSAFPYKEHLYTIQYQTWWVLPSDGQIHHEDSLDSTARLLNRALDWMQECRDYAIPNTSGAFISFKDSSIPTSRYFDKNYTRLIRIKHTRSQDPNNLFRSRKTII
jgi:hypothetical protein